MTKEWQKTVVRTLIQKWGEVLRSNQLYHTRLGDPTNDGSSIKYIDQWPPNINLVLKDGTKIKISVIIED
jgi:hypothetical protein